MELSETVKSALSHAVMVWADENLAGKPVVIVYAMYQALERLMAEQAEKVSALWGDK